MPRAYTVLTPAIAALVVLASGAVIFADLYSREPVLWALQASGQDLANLASIPALLAAAYFANKGSMRALLVWMGVLLFLIYAYVIYAFDVQYNRLFLVYVAILGLSFFALSSRAAGLYRAGRVFPANGRARHVSVFLMAVAALFYFQWLSQDVPAALAGDLPEGLGEIGLPTNPIHVLDLGFFLPAMIVSAVFLWKGKMLGHLSAVPLLVFSALTGAGILFSNALMRLNEIPTGFVADAVVGAVVAASVVLGWLYLSEMKRLGKCRISALYGSG